MAHLKFRPLKAEEVECRIGTVTSKGATLLLYKTARTDMDILDETVGAENWQTQFYELGGKLFCKLGIRIGGEWIWKDDCGVEGNVGEEKSQASDARKRAGFAWGIGRELYRSPFIFASIPVVKDGNRYKPDGFPRFDVTEFASDGIRVTRLTIVDDNGKVIKRYRGEVHNEVPESAATKYDQPRATVQQESKHIMTREEFKVRWESNELGGGITYDDIADCAKAWGICGNPRTHDINKIKDMVLSAAGINEQPVVPDLMPGGARFLSAVEGHAQGKTTPRGTYRDIWAAKVNADATLLAAFDSAVENYRINNNI